MELALTFIIVFIAALIGATPLGLVNISVMDSSYRKGSSSALNIAHGAAFIELLFVLLAILAGSFITTISKNSSWFEVIFYSIPIITGIVFLFKKSNSPQQKSLLHNNFIKGVFLNIISVQVLMYWVMAIAFINASWKMINNFSLLPIVLLAVWVGKMFVLWLYAKYSNFFYSRLTFLSKNINIVIGLILIIIGVIQFIKS